MFYTLGSHPLDGFLHFGCIAQELPLRYGNFAAYFFQRQRMVHFCFIAQAQAAFAHSARFFVFDFAAQFVVLRPKIAVHFGGYGQRAAVVVNGGVWFAAAKRERIAANPRADGAAQFAGLDQRGSFAFTLTLWPRFGKERLALEVPVELVGEFHLQVGQYLGD